MRVSGTWAYVDPVGVRPGDALRLHLSAEAASTSEVVRLGHEVLDPQGDHQVIDRVDHPAALPQRLRPGSYVWVGGDAVDVPAVTLSVWVRLWAAPRRETIQWYAAGLITDMDYPDHCRFGLLVDGMCQPAIYLGDGAEFRHLWLLRSPRSLAIGSWHHVAAILTGERATLFVDGEAVVSGPGRSSPPGPAARLRIGAWAEAGRANGHLDGDLSQPFVAGRALSAGDVSRVFADRGRSGPQTLVNDGIVGAWQLDEECGVRLADSSASGRDALLVGGAQWGIGGPTFDAAVPGYEYDPATDPDRGHGIRLSSDDLLDCEWPVAATFGIPADAPSGLYAVRVTLAGQSAQDALMVPFVVVRPRPQRPGAILLVVPTNTWNAYGRRFDDIAVPPGLHSSFYTAHANGTPFFELGTRVPTPQAHPFRGDSDRADRQGHAQLVRPEWIALSWLRQQSYPVECITDLELHRGDTDLDAFACVLLAGHSEYWSTEMRQRVESYLSRGGRLLSLSGDTASQRVVIAEDGSTIQARKISESDPLWLTPERWGERWHPCGQGPGGRFRSIGMPPWQTFGVSTKGMIDDGLPSAFSAMDVLAPDHFLFHDPEPVPVGPSGVIGERSINGPAVSGYEFDATPQVTGFLDEPLPGLTVLARARGQYNTGAIGAPVDGGADAIYWERPDGGRVVTISSIGATGSLPVDPGVAALVRNALHHLGAIRDAHAGS